MERLPTDEQRVLVAAPSGRDSELICAVLRSWNVSCESVPPETVSRHLEEGAGALIVAEEALTPELTSDLTTFVRRQPFWSDLPVVLLTHGGETTYHSRRMFELRQPLGTVLVLERPIRRETLVAAAQSAVQSRRRQYQLRDQVLALRRSEEQLRESRTELNAAIAASETGTFRWDPRADRFLHFDPSLKGLFGLDPDAPVETTADFLALVHPEDQAAIIAAVERCRLDGEMEVEHRIIRPDGEIRWLYDRGKRVSNGAMHAIVGACTDITSRKRTEEALRRSEKLAAVGRLAATTAHEINNPLESVTNLLFLARRSADVREIHAYLASAEQELGRVIQLTKQTLGFYREQSAPSSFDACALMDNVLSLYHSKLVGKSLRVVREYGAPCNVVAVEGQMRQVISNVLANAIDVAPPGSEIGASVEICPGPRGDLVVWSIEDRGAGMSKAVLERVFEPFFTTKKDLGTGLGLWLSKDLVSKQGGEIRISSSITAPTGTRVSICIPLDASKSQAA